MVTGISSENPWSNPLTNPRLISFRFLTDVIIRGKSVGDRLKGRGKFVAGLTEGVLKNYTYFKEFLRPYLPRKTSEEAMILVSMGLYQVFYMGVPAYASVNETVSLAGMIGKSYLKGFVNGVLRSVLSDLEGAKGEFEELRREKFYLVLPGFLKSRFFGLLGEDGCRRFILSSLSSPPLTLSVNTNKISVEGFLEILVESGIKCERTRFSPVGIRVFGHFSPVSIPGFNEGLFFVQDESSQIVSTIVSPKGGERVLDAGAFPGGKTLSMFVASGGMAEIWSIDNDPTRRSLFLENLKRLDAKGIKVLVMDFRKFRATFPFHKGILDAPCSSFGIFGRRPDVFYTRRESDLLSYRKLQVELLEAMMRAVKRGGLVVYSVCTATPEETLQVVEDVERKFPLERVDVSFQFPAFSPFLKGDFLVLLSPEENYYMDLMFAAVWRKL